MAPSASRKHAPRQVCHTITAERTKRTLRNPQPLSDGAVGLAEARAPTGVSHHNRRENEANPRNPQPLSDGAVGLAEARAPIGVSHHNRGENEANPAETPATL